MLKVFLWYLFVFLALILLFLSFLYKNIYITLIAFLLTLFLNKYTNKIPVSKLYDKFKVISFKNSNKDR